MSNIINFIKQYNIPLFNEKKISNHLLLSNSFGAFCIKINLNNRKKYIVKGTLEKNNNYDSIFYEGKSLEFLNDKLPELFPKVLYVNKNILVIEFIAHNKIKNKNSEKDLARKIAQIHQLKNNQYGFKYDTPIGGLKQPSDFSKSWVDFYGKKRLGMIFEIINLTNPMTKEINRGIEKILKNLGNLIPDKPVPSLIHGDLWEGNILFNDGKLVGLIDPGIHYAHNEMEIAYLKWFQYIGNDFYDYYSDFIIIDKDFFNYSEVYELYYSLLNVHLWSREYVQNVAKLVNKFK